MEYGYIRVSTRDQNEQRQWIALRAFGIGEGQIYLDKQSGKDFARKGYRKLVRRLKSGDVLVVKSIDRLGRNYEEILRQWRMLTKDKGGGYRSSGYAPSGYPPGEGSDGNLPE